MYDCLEILFIHYSNLQVIKDYKLFMVVGVLVAIDVVTLTTWQIVDPFYRETSLGVAVVSSYSLYPGNSFFPFFFPVSQIPSLGARKYIISSVYILQPFLDLMKASLIIISSFLFPSFICHQLVICSWSAKGTIRIRIDEKKKEWEHSVPFSLLHFYKSSNLIVLRLPSLRNLFDMTYIPFIVHYALFI